MENAAMSERMTDERLAEYVEAGDADMTSERGTLGLTIARLEGALQRAEVAIAELEASALTGYEDGWHKLRSERDELKAKVAELEAALTKYGRHDLGCERNSFPTKISEFEIKRRPCTCGLSDLIKEQGDDE